MKFWSSEFSSGRPSWKTYPLDFLWQTTPVVLAGLALAAAAALRRRALLTGAARARRGAAVLALFTVLFAVFLETGAKQAGRYLLPAFLAPELKALRLEHKLDIVDVAELLGLYPATLADAEAAQLLVTPAFAQLWRASILHLAEHVRLERRERRRHALCVA